MTLRLRVKSIGSGVEGDPYRVNAPTWILISHDEDKKIAVIEIPTHAHPFDAEMLAAIPIDDHPDHGKLHRFEDDHFAILHEHFDDKYEAKYGTYRLELA